MAAIDPGILLRARLYLSIAHHIPGRIRLKFQPAILREVPELATPAGRAALESWNVIQDIKVNTMGLSLLLQYDATRLEPGSWERLIEGSEEEARAVVEDLRAMAG